MHIGGSTRCFAVLGHPIGHSLSPIMHNAAFATLGLDAVYLAFDVTPERLPMLLPALQELGFGGVNLTIPLKEAAYRFLSDLDESAQLLGAVNTVAFRSSGPVGHNTDGYGFLQSVSESFGGAIAGRSVFILGAGGAGRAIALTCAKAGALSLAVADLNSDLCGTVRRDAARVEPSLSVQVPTTPDEVAAEARAADIIVQATPVGMRKDDASPLPPQVFRPDQWALDLVYQHIETAFLRAARTAGARTATGLGMLLHQGARALEIWTDRSPPLAEMRTALEKAVYGRILSR